MLCVFAMFLELFGTLFMLCPLGGPMHKQYVDQFERFGLLQNMPMSRTPLFSEVNMCGCDFGLSSYALGTGFDLCVC